MICSLILLLAWYGPKLKDIEHTKFRSDKFLENNPFAGRGRSMRVIRYYNWTLLNWSHWTGIRKRSTFGFDTSDVQPSSTRELLSFCLFWQVACDYLLPNLDLVAIRSSLLTTCETIYYCAVDIALLIYLNDLLWLVVTSCSHTRVLDWMKMFISLYTPLITGNYSAIAICRLYNSLLHTHTHTHTHTSRLLVTELKHRNYKSLAELHTSNITHEIFPSQPHSCN
jgi:hypothetical protein